MRAPAPLPAPLFASLSAHLAASLSAHPSAFNFSLALSRRWYPSCPFPCRDQRKHFKQVFIICFLEFLEYVKSGMQLHHTRLSGAWLTCLTWQ